MHYHETGEHENVIRLFEEAIAELLIERKGDYAYEKAVECSFVLRKILDDAAWQEYIKGLYERHSRKINLWREFKRNEVTVKILKLYTFLSVRQTLDNILHACSVKQPHRSINLSRLTLGSHP